ncbi:aldo/keto reductase family oxidoreductase [Levilactobacillus brevis]|uniref:Oxidoreductase, aldo/keto reductase family protein n=1 Tax=Levilactobacillus brevis ATCC 14869 = DSM 20054 TaxID=649758 RepID=U2QXW7_LEVBR|nr:aldo/keto reductase [Levilactobacillus brevis]ERK43577.1 oxidoreductase, aldo/keto reductase family protein [Levilactobacillus brevis ATCC 14869 = DSM 20054]KIO99132.1 Oxidoreductase, aldo/keto reductase family [Levilactobacillus brevis]KRK20777.1 oxidoreductase [Levilactobacillus brevis ATCC 14869 = DSM 20054]MCT3572932.1 aldo/keto reductase [Levilactobacillus brevis]SQG81872.1 aldo/keto reductase family protein [Levilactobacillus brevis]
MKTIKLGNSQLEKSAVALGIMRMVRLDSQDATKVLEVIHDREINFIDSADIYGNGDSERIFGKAFKQSSLKREDFFIQSKGGIVLDPEKSSGELVFGQRYDFSKEHLLETVDQILQRMQIDYLDSFLLHRPDSLMDPAEVSAAFDELQAAGKVRHFGVSNFNPMQVELLQSVLSQHLMINQLQFGVMHTGPIQFGLHTNMQDEASINHDGEILEYSRLHNMTIQAWSPYQYGLFEGTFINNSKFSELNDELQALADKYGVTKNAIATAWILRHPAKMQVILGSMNPEHLDESIAGTEVTLTRQEWYDVYLAAGNDLP